MYIGIALSNSTMIGTSGLAMLIHSPPEVFRKTSVFTARRQGQTPKAVELLSGQSKRGMRTLPCPLGHGHRERLCMSVSVVTVDPPVTDKHCR